MELRHLRYFLAVAQEANVTRAAAKLGIGQPPLSQQIKQLERELNVRLFDRTAFGVVLTRAGLAFEVEARRVLADAERAVRAAQRAERGESGLLRVGFTGSAAFNPVVAASIKRFRKAFPGAELILEEANTLYLLQGLEEERLDVVFLRPGIKDIAGLILHRFPDESMKIAVPSDHALARQRSASMACLRHEPFILYPRAAGISLYEEVLDACAAVGFTPTLAQEAPQISSVINLVAADLGISIVPAAIAQITLDGVRYLDIEGHAPVARLALASKPGRDDPMIRHFLAISAA